MADPTAPFSPKAGEVYRMTFDSGDGIRPKNPGDVSRDKYFVVAGVDRETVTVVSVYINSEINVRKFFRIEQFQLMIRRDDYPFMTKEFSYIDCSQLMRLDIARLERDAKYVCDLTPSDLASIRKLVRAVPSVNKGLLKRYGLK